MPHRNRVLIILAIATLLPLGCVTHRQTIGSGFHTGYQEVHYQWYALRGLVALNEKDGGKLAGVEKCRITTQYSFSDCLINLFTRALTVERRTVIVEK